MISHKCYKNDLEMFLKTYITPKFFCAYLRFVIYCSMTSYKKHASSDRYIYFSVYQNDITTRKRMFSRIWELPSAAVYNHSRLSAKLSDH